MGGDNRFLVPNDFVLRLSSPSLSPTYASRALTHKSGDYLHSTTHSLTILCQPWNKLCVISGFRVVVHSSLLLLKKETCLHTNTHTRTHIDGNESDDDHGGGGGGDNRNQFKLCTFIYSTEFKCDTNLHERYIDVGTHTFSRLHSKHFNSSEYSEKAIIYVYICVERSMNMNAEHWTVCESVLSCTLHIQSGLPPLFWMWNNLNMSAVLFLRSHSLPVRRDLLSTFTVWIFKRQLQPSCASIEMAESWC